MDYCDLPIKAKGLCGKHYLRIYRTPTPGLHIGAKGDVPCYCDRELGGWGRHLTSCVNAERTQHTMGDAPGGPVHT